MSGGKAYVNGKVTPSASVTELLYYNGSVYQQNVNNNWWQWKDAAWVALAADPRVPALASAAGYKTLTFDSTVLGTTSGTWRTSNLNDIPGCAMPPNRMMTVLSRSGQQQPQCLRDFAVKPPLAPTVERRDVQARHDLKLVVSTVGSNKPDGYAVAPLPSNVPGFWGTSIEHADGGKKANGALLDQWPGQAANFEHWSETDCTMAYCYECDVPVDQNTILFRDRLVLPAPRAVKR